MGRKLNTITHSNIESIGDPATNRSLAKKKPVAAKKTASTKAPIDPKSATEVYSWGSDVSG